MSNILFEGIYAATFSIYDENMNVKRDSVEKLVNYNLKNGLKGFYVGGNTGECTVLPNKTRKQMLEAVKEFAPAGTQIMAHVGAGHLEDVEDLIRHANEVGVDAIASLPPSLTSYYNSEEIVDYYRYIASLSKSPVLSYVTPVLTCDVVWFAKQILAIENVIGLKVSIPNYYAFERMKMVNNGDINILNGPDECLVSGLAMGADGAVGTTYNLMPATAVKIFEDFKKGDVKAALKGQNKLNRLVDAVLGNNLATWKAVMDVIGIDPGHTVAPAQMPSKEKMAGIIKQLEAAGCLDEMHL